MAAAKLGFAAVLQSHLDAVGAANDLPVVVCGMAGARQGWVEAGYIDTPAHLAFILERAVPVPGRSRDIRILPGIAQRDPKAPDVMRGEETQLLGALGVDAAGEAVVCIPGTHSKWARVSGGTVERFATFMTGELFSVVSRETILSHAVVDADEAEDTEAFKSAVVAAFKTPALAANLLFRVRSSQLLYGGSPSSAREKISGTLIGLELAAGLAGDQSSSGITLVASGRLQVLYRLAFDTLSVAVQSIDAEEAVRRGLSMAAEAIWTFGGDDRSWWRSGQSYGKKVGYLVAHPQIDAALYQLAVELQIGIHISLMRDVICAAPRRCDSSRLRIAVAGGSALKA